MKETGLANGLANGLIYRATHRGTKEIGLLLGAFVRHKLENSSDATQLHALIHLPDTVIMDLIFHKQTEEPPCGPKLDGLIDALPGELLDKLLGELRRFATSRFKVLKQSIEGRTRA